MASEAAPRLVTVFKDLGDQLEVTAADLKGLNGVLKLSEARLVRGLAHGARIEELIGRINSRIHAFAKPSANASGR